MIDTQTSITASGGDLQTIVNHWDLQIFRAEKIRDVYKIYTNQGIKNLKVSPRLPERLLFVHQAINHLIKQGFTKMVPLIPSREGTTYVCDHQWAYSLFDWIEGRQSDCRNEAELIDSTKILAEFHQKSTGFVPPEGSNMRDRLGKCLKHFEERYQDLLEFKASAKLNQSDSFAKAYWESVDFFLPMAEQAITKLKGSSYLDLVARAQIIKPFCHGDPAARNFIITPEQQVFMIDFDSCRLDLPIMDLIKFTRRVMKKYHWRYQTAQLLFDSYQAVYPLTQNELEVIKAVFYFPQKFWRLSIRYFHEHGRYTDERSFQKFKKFLRNKAQLAQFQTEFEDYNL